MLKNKVQDPIIDSYDAYTKIIHVDMDAFYASVEQRDFPELRGKPIAVGGGGKRGVTTTASYEARKYGVKSAMPGWKAKELCPNIIFVDLRFDAYKQASREIRKVFEQYTDIIEPLSLDEAFLDVTSNKMNIRYATDAAIQIQKDIFENTGLTCSAGVSYCKFIAKVASDLRKPNGISVITPRKAITFLEELPITKFFGVGKVTAQKMQSLGIHNGLDLKQWTKENLIKNFGKSGGFFYEIVRGNDNRPVEPNRERKSLAVERTYDENISDLDTVLTNTEYISQMLANSIMKSHFYGKTLTLKLKDRDFIQKTRSITITEVFKTFDQVYKEARNLVLSNQEICTNLRLIGLSISNVENENPKINEVKKEERLKDLFDLDF
jgi:DNA polymerase IV